MGFYDPDVLFADGQASGSRLKREFRLSKILSLTESKVGFSEESPGAALPV